MQADGPKTNTEADCAAGGEMYRAGFSILGARLLSAAMQVRRGHVAADIGCDHGKLAVFLAKRGLCPRVIAVDSRPLPLARAVAAARRAGVADRVDCRLGDGLQPLSPGEATDIVIAGLSGETIVQILAAAPWVAAENIRLLLVPTARAERLRAWLCESGFALTREQAVIENHRPYTVMTADYTGEEYCPTPLFCEVGVLQHDHSAAAQQIKERRAAYLRSRLQAPLDEAERAALQQLIEEVEACI